MYFIQDEGQTKDGQVGSYGDLQPCTFVSKIDEWDYLQGEHHTAGNDGHVSYNVE